MVVNLLKQKDTCNTDDYKVFKSFVSHVDSHKADLGSCHFTSKEAKKNGQEKEPRQTY